MPLRNRVTPFGEIVAVPAHGLLLGNRGVLHDACVAIGGSASLAGTVTSSFGVSSGATVTVLSGGVMNGGTAGPVGISGTVNLQSGGTAELENPDARGLIAD